MGTTTIRFTEEEQEIVKKLTEHFGMEPSTVIKKALFELYEDVKDLEAIEEFEKREERGEVEWMTSDELKKEIDVQ